ncbi:MAG TPA: hypothetical protein VNA20_00165 [Frankiaceae bacterium]|nr:hypothetical protein [Frankiaceae bacterium]
MPRWVKAFVGVGVLVALVALVAMLTGDGHGPGRHLRQGHGAAPAAGGR